TLPDFIYLVSRRQPISPLFPYTTLFRSYCDVTRELIGRIYADYNRLQQQNRGSAPPLALRRETANGVIRLGYLSADFRGHVMGRSEEHTSELQSLAYLVCRLLLEKKKTD